LKKLLARTVKPPVDYTSEESPGDSKPIASPGAVQSNKSLSHPLRYRSPVRELGTGCNGASGIEFSLFGLRGKDMRLRSIAWLGCLVAVLGCGRNPDPPAISTTPTKPKPSVVEQPTPTTPVTDETKPKLMRISALAQADEYLQLFKNGPVLLPPEPLPSETETCYQRRMTASPDRPLYSFSSFEIDPIAEDPSQNRVAFRGKANVTSRYNPLNEDKIARHFDWGVPTGGTVPFTLELVRAAADADWQVDDFRFERRKPQAGPAVLSEAE